jgi:hypothetical protein
MVCWPSVDGSNITTGQRRWLHHHRRMVRWPGVNGSITTAGWHAGPALMVPSPPPDGTPVWRRWFHHYRQLALQAGVDVYNVSAGP